MHALLSSLVASSLLMHAVLGCCWHHGHGSSCCNESQHRSIVDANCDHDHDCCEEEHDDTTPTPCKGGPHCHSVCNYLPVPKTHIDPAQHNMPLDIVATVSTPTDVHIVAAHGLNRLYELDTGPRLRLHLVHQILLI